MGFDFPDSDKEKMKLDFTPKPEVFPINTMKIKSLDDVKILLAVLGLAATKEFAKEHNIEHLLDD